MYYYFYFFVILYSSFVLNTLKKFSGAATNVDTFEGNKIKIKQIPGLQGILKN